MTLQSTIEQLSNTIKGLINTHNNSESAHSDIRNNLNNKISKSSTQGLVKNDGSIIKVYDSSGAVTDVNEIVNIGALGDILTDGNFEVYTNKTTSWHNDNETNHTRYPTEKLVKDSLNDLSANKISKSATQGLVKNDGSIIKVYDSSGAVTDMNEIVSIGALGDVLAQSQYETYTNKTSSWHAETNNTRYPTEKLVKDSLDAISSEIQNITTGDIDLSGTHTHATNSITNNNAYDNIKIGESTQLTLTDQEKINAAINTKIGELTNLKFLEVTTNKGTASASTMNKIYVENKNNKTDIYYTTKSGNTYTWEKLEDDILEDITVPDYVTNYQTDVQADIETFANALITELTS